MVALVASLTLFQLAFLLGEKVTMSVSKLLTRIVAPSEQDLNDQMTNESMLHDHTYGITSDPLTQFSCVLAALLHDIDHPGDLPLLFIHSTLLRNYI